MPNNYSLPRYKKNNRIHNVQENSVCSKSENDNSSSYGVKLLKYIRRISVLFFLPYSKGLPCTFFQSCGKTTRVKEIYFLFECSWQHLSEHIFKVATHHLNLNVQIAMKISSVVCVCAYDSLLYFLTNVYQRVSTI